MIYCCCWHFHYFLLLLLLLPTTTSTRLMLLYPGSSRERQVNIPTTTLSQKYSLYQYNTQTAFQGYMGVYISKLLDSFREKEAKVVMVGLDAAGKTTILYKLHLRGSDCHLTPTIGFNVERVKYKRLNFTAWDIGGQDILRKLWYHYYDGTDAIIFVVDSNDSERIEDAKEEL